MDIREDIKHYQDTLSYASSYASSKVDYSVGENIYMLPSDMNLKIKTGTVRYNNKILVSDEKFSLGKNAEVNTPAMKSHTQPAANSNDVLGLGPHHVDHKHQLSLINLKLPLTLVITMKKLLWYWLWQVVLQYGICFDKIQ